MFPWGSIYATVSCEHMAIPYLSHVPTHRLERRNQRNNTRTSLKSFLMNCSTIRLKYN